MKVLFLRTDYYGHVSVGGSFTHTGGFLRGLQASGHEAAIVSSGTFPLPPGIPFYTIPYSPLFRNLPEVLSLAYNYRFLRKAGDVVAAERPDVLYHRHSEFHFSSSLLAQRYDIPLVLEFNGSELWVKKNWGQLYLENLLRMTEQIQLSRATIITVVSSVLKDQLVNSGIEADRILVNPNGVDPDVFHPDVDGSEIRKRFGLVGKIVAGFVGTFGAWHGVEILARAVRPTIERNENIHFLMIGTGGLQGTIDRILKESGSAHAVTTPGSVPHEEIPRYLAACDILLSPHVQNVDGTEFFGSPTKLFEYMAAGKAIVASPVGQIAEVLKDGFSALFMTPNDPKSLSELITLLGGDSNLRATLGKNARKHAVEQFSWRRNAERVIEAVSPFVKPKQ